MANILKNLFSTTPDKQTDRDVSDQTSFQSNDNIRQGETYTFYGKRLCGVVTGKVEALPAFLTKVCQTEQQRQVNDRQQQMQMRGQLQRDLQQTQGQEQNTRASLSNIRATIESTQDKINDKQIELEEAKAKDGKENKMERIKLVIGLIILLILMFYLFIFYSSTFYSAFLLNANDLLDASDGEVALSMAVFNAKAIQMAAKDSIGALLFILSGPVIFLGLGFALHFFMVQKSNAKWLKSAALLTVTLTFDCILAYKIGQLLYEVTRLSSWGDMPPYSFRLAVEDINTWAVIFLGFIVYVIWGIVFDMTMTAYRDLNSNKEEINRIKKEIEQAKDFILRQTQQIAPLEAQLAQLASKVASYNQQLARGFYVDNQQMLTALADFFAGWMSIMPQLNNDPTEVNSAQQTYQRTIQQFTT